MLNKKISQLSGATLPLTGTEELPVVQGIKTLKVTTQDIANLAGLGNYKKYVALLTQTGTDDPVAVVFENTLGEEIVWTRTGVGSYQAACSLLTDIDGYSDNQAFSNIFSYNFISVGGISGSLNDYYLEQWFETGMIKLLTTVINRDDQIINLVDDQLYFKPFELRIY